MVHNVIVLPEFFDKTYCIFFGVLATVATKTARCCRFTTLFSKTEPLFRPSFQATRLPHCVICRSTVGIGR